MGRPDLLGPILANASSIRAGKVYVSASEALKWMLVNSVYLRCNLAQRSLS